MTRRQVGQSLIPFVILLFASFALIRHSVDLSPPTVFQLRNLRCYQIADQPSSTYGDCRIEADFEYHGPDFVSHSRFRDFLIRFGVLGPQPRPPQTADVVLSDENGRELARLTGNGMTASATSARFGYMRNGRPDQFAFLWNFKLPPPGLNHSHPIKFSTALSLKDFPPQLVEVIIPATGPQAPAPSD